MKLDRREFLIGGASLLAVPRVLFAEAASDRRFVFIIQRGAADGLHTVVPYADPGYARLRGSLALDPSATLRLDGLFALHPSLQTLAGLYAARQAIFLHAVASAYRDRSHFDGQNVLETGGSVPFQLKDGWMNRLLALLSGDRGRAIAMSAAIPLVLRGTVDVTSYAPTDLPGASEDLLLRIHRLYENDPVLSSLWSSALEVRQMGGDAAKDGSVRDSNRLGRIAASFLAQASGPRIAVIETDGWDTHSSQDRRMTARLASLDSLVAGLHSGLQDTWDQTVILIATEFGRTVSSNGTFGTDHGTGAVAMLLGGAVNGGRVISDWPGLGQADLLEGRDLKPTMNLESVISSVCAQTFMLEPQAVARQLFAQHQNLTNTEQWIHAGRG